MTDPIPVSIPEKDPLLLDLDIPRSTSAPTTSVPLVAPVAAPLPVIIAPEQEPIPVVVATAAAAPVPLMPPTVTKLEGVTLPPTTTEEQDIVTKGQRHINKIWEYSQSFIALAITLAVIYCAVNEITSQELSNGFFLIIGFYFSRQNHQNTGGVGPKPDASVQSR